MTIALGILAKDGIVIAADTQESIGSSKTETRKIYTRLIPKEQRGFCGTGAGGAVYLDALLQRLARGFWRAQSQTESEANLSDLLRKFYDAHVLRVLSVDAKADVEQELIVGLTRQGVEPILISSERAAFRECKDFSAVGVGSDHALVLLRRLISSSSHITVELAAYIAAYVIYQVKETHEYCGKGTHVTILQDGTGRYFTPRAIELLETSFRQYSDWEAIAAGYMLGREVLEDDGSGSIAARLEKLRQRVNSLQLSLAQEPEWTFKWANDWRPSSGEIFEPIKGKAILEPFRPSVVKPPAQAVRPVPLATKRGRKGQPPSRG